MLTAAGTISGRFLDPIKNGNARSWLDVPVLVMAWLATAELLPMPIIVKF